VYVNLYASNNADVTLNKNKIHFSQETDYPWKGNVSLAVNPEQTSSFTLKLRIPGWSRNQVMPGDLYEYIGNGLPSVAIKVNGKEVSNTVNQGYAGITSQWKKGDVVELSLPMDVRRVVASDKVQQDKNQVALEYGPIVYCIEGTDNSENTFSMRLPDQVPLTVSFDEKLLGGVNVINGNTLLDNGGEQAMTAIPYYVWSNRGISTMKVWLPR
jgi:DUF1680 family protein